MVPVSRLVGRMAGMRTHLASAPPGPGGAVTARPRVVATPFASALMERAAATGIGAAAAILAARGYRTEPVWSVPPRGILARRWAAAMRRGPAQPGRAG